MSRLSAHASGSLRFAHVADNRLFGLYRTEDMQSLGTSDYMGSAHWRSANNNNDEDPDDAYPFVSD